MYKNKKRSAYASNPNRSRLIATFVVFGVCYVILLFKLLTFQVIRDEKLQTLTKKQETKTVTLTSPRGTIFDSTMRALAVSIKVPSVYLDPKILEIKDHQVKKLRSLLSISRSTWKNKIKNKNKRFVWLKRKVNPELEKAIRELDVYGLGIVYEWDRLYPDREFASQVLGFVNLDGQGMEGLERQYEKSLYSHGIKIKTQKDAKGRSILVGENVELERKKGFDIVLTIDSGLQYFLEDELSIAATQADVKAGFGTIMDPHTGKVLAMASYPQMNPNRIDQSSASSRKNRNVLEVFEPGSTFKAFVMTQGLEDKIVTHDEVMNCKEGSLRIGKKKIRNPVDKDWLTPKGIIKFSNNVCMAQIGIKGGKELMTKVMNNFGFGRKTGIDFPVEASGLFDLERTWRDMRLANLSFGQGVSVTSIQMVRAMSVIANGGWLVQPYVVEKMITGTGKVLDVAPKARKRRTYSQETIDRMKEYLTSVTDKDGTGKNARLDGFSVAGKTGTAQIYDFETKSYSHDHVVSSFLGFVPAEKPELVVYIVLYKPKEGEHGGTIAAPVFQKVMKKALPYLHIQSEQEAVASK